MYCHEAWAAVWIPIRIMYVMKNPSHLHPIMDVVDFGYCETKG